MDDIYYFHFNSKRELKTVTKNKELKPTPGMKYLAEYDGIFERIYYHANKTHSFTGQSYWAMYIRIPEEYKKDMRKAIEAYLLLVN